MAEFPALPLFTDAYIADTPHLTNEEHGVYLRLLMFAWRSTDCALPDDDKKLSRMVGVSPRKWKILKVTIMEFWSLENGRWSQKRLTRERDFLMSKKAKASDAARKRWDTKPKISTSKISIPDKKVVENEDDKSLKYEETGSKDAYAKRMPPHPHPHPEEEVRDSPRTPHIENPTFELEEIKPPERDEIRLAFDAYCTFAAEFNIPVPTAFTEPRKKQIKARLKDCGGIDGWKHAIDNARHMPFLHGDNRDGWTCSLDSFTQAKTFTKIMEGGCYGDTRHKRPGYSSGRSESGLDVFGRELEEAKRRLREN